MSDPNRYREPPRRRRQSRRERRRNLIIRRILIVAVGVLLVVAIIGVIWGIVHLVGAGGESSSASAVSSMPVSSIASQSLPVKTG